MSSIHVFFIFLKTKGLSEFKKDFGMDEVWTKHDRFPTVNLTWNAMTLHNMDDNEI